MSNEQTEQIIVRGYISPKQHQIAWSWLSGKNAKQAAQHVKYGAEAVLRMMSLGLQLNVQSADIDSTQFDSVDGPIITPSFTVSSHLFPSLYKRLAELADNADRNSEILMLFEIWVFAVWGRTVGSSNTSFLPDQEISSGDKPKDVPPKSLGEMEPVVTETFEAQLTREGREDHEGREARVAKEPAHMGRTAQEDQPQGGNDQKSKGGSPLSGFQKKGLRKG